jgi:hypothetical protein
MPTINDRKNTYADRVKNFGAETERYKKLVRNTNLARGVAFFHTIWIFLAEIPSSKW